MGLPPGTDRCPGEVAREKVHGQIRARRGHHDPRAAPQSRGPRLRAGTPRSFKPADDKDHQAGKCDGPAQRDIRYHAYNDAEEDQGKPDAIPFASLARETN